jgi:uncharacterized membrane protein YkvA (DUF1232 family)
MTWKERARELKREVTALYFAARHPRTPWYAKAFALGVVGYAFSPIDLIPDFIPVLGLLDELILVPLAVLALRAMIPEDVMAECRAKALEERPTSRVAAAIIILIWVSLAAVAAYLLFG